MAIGPAPELIADNTRSISLKQMHTGETLTVTYKRNGRYVPEAMRKINYMMRDWRRDESIKMDPRLIDLVYDVHKAVGSRAPIEILSGYRSPVTNAALRRRSRNVAKFSQHMVGKALDFRIPDVPVRRVRETAMRMQRGGVGYYRGTFVHLDVARVRSWPRMTRAQLMRLFPDGRTVHLPSDGKPLPGYAEAKRVIERAGGASGSRDLFEDDTDTDRSLIANRGRAGEDATLMVADRGSPAQPAQAAPQPEPEPARAPEPVRAPEPTPQPTVAAAAPPPNTPPPRARPETPEATDTQSEETSAIAGLNPANIPLPLVRPETAVIEEAPQALALAEGVPLPPARPLLSAPPSGVDAAQSAQDGASAITALLATGMPPALTTGGLRGTLPSGFFEGADLSAGMADAKTVDGLVTISSIIADLRAAVFTHPDQHHLSSMMSVPVAILENRFGRSANRPHNLVVQRFTGPAVHSLETRVFVEGASLGAASLQTSALLGDQ